MMPVSVGVGDKVLLPEYGGTQVIIEDKVHFHIFVVFTIRTFFQTETTLWYKIIWKDIQLQWFFIDYESQRYRIQVKGLETSSIWSPICLLVVSMFDTYMCITLSP